MTRRFIMPTRNNKTPLQKSYEKARAQLGRKLKSLEKRGYVYLDKAGGINSVSDLMPKIPKRITSASVRNIQNLSKNIYKKIKYSDVNPETGEFTLTSGVRGRELEAEKAAQKAVKTREPIKRAIQGYKRGLSGVLTEYDKALNDNDRARAESLKPYIIEYANNLSEIDKKFKFKREQDDIYYQNGRLYEKQIVNGTEYGAKEIAEYAKRTQYEDTSMSDFDLAEMLDEENLEIAAEIQREFERERAIEEQERIFREEEQRRKEEQEENIEEAKNAGFITEDEAEEEPDTSGYDDIMQAYEEAKKEAFDEAKWRANKNAELTEADIDEIIDVILGNAFDRLGNWIPPSWFNGQMTSTQNNAINEVYGALSFAQINMNKLDLAKRLVENESLIGDIVDALTSGYIDEKTANKINELYSVFAGNAMDLGTNMAITDYMEESEDWAI